MKLEALQEAMARECEDVDCQVIHNFSDGIYARTLIIEPNMCVVGATHRTNHFLTIMKGDGFIVTNDGEPEYYEAPCLIETKKGVKRAFTTLTETIMTTFHVTDETDIDKIGDTIIEPEGLKLPQWKKKALEVH